MLRTTGQTIHAPRRCVTHRSAVEAFMVTHGTPAERSARSSALALSLVSLFIGAPVGTFLLGPLGLAAALGIPVYLIVRFERVMAAARLRIARERLCFECGYPLLHLRVEPDGRGTCPECGCPFSTASYVLPGEGRRGALESRPAATAAPSSSGGRGAPET